MMWRWCRWLLIVGSILLFAVGCGGREETAVSSNGEDDELAFDSVSLPLPTVTAVALDGQPLRVVVTTNIIGDVVRQVGGDAIDLTVLMDKGQDPHSYEPGARELTAVASAHLIIINGWGLEAGLVQDLAEVGAGVPILPISAGIEPRLLGDEAHDEAEEDDEHGQYDPHVWFNIDYVAQWVENSVQVLSDLDPANRDHFEANGQAYLSQLEALKAYAATQLGTIPEEDRLLVTNHDALGYLAEAYGFTVLGTVIPSTSTVAEPSAEGLSQLITTMSVNEVCTIFTETAVSSTLAQTVADELSHCPQVRVVPLYTGTLGEPGSEADTFLGMYRANVDAIVAGLQN